MIIKQPRNNAEGKYDLKITDKNGNAFIMTEGGNYDLYWLPENPKENRVFEIDKSDKITYSVFNQLFNAVIKQDDKDRPVFKDGIITFISEDWPEEEANVLNIIKTEDAFAVKFIKNEDKENWSYPHIGCTICFCNSGSRVPKVEQVFMEMFNYLAYESKLIACESIEEEKVK